MLDQSLAKVQYQGKLWEKGIFPLKCNAWHGRTFARVLKTLYAMD